MVCYDTASGAPRQIWQERVALAEGQTVQFDVQLQDTGVILGQVTGFAPGARVDVLLMSAESPEAPLLPTRCDEEGRFEFTGVRAGQYSVRAVQSGEPSLEAEQTVSLDPGEEQTLTLQLH